MPPWPTSADGTPLPLRDHARVGVDQLILDLLPLDGVLVRLIFVIVAAAVLAFASVDEATQDLGAVNLCKSTNLTRWRSRVCAEKQS